MKNIRAWAIAVVAGVLVPAVLWAANQQFSVPSTPSTIINCESGGGCNIVINQASPVIQQSEDQFGGTTGLDSLRLKNDLTVDDDVTVTGDLAVTGTSTVAGYTSSTSIVREAYAGYTGSASSQTLCAIRNTGSQDRILTEAMTGYATNTATGGGVQRLTISLSTTQGATGTGSNLLFDSSDLAVPTNGLLNFTTTSTLQGTGAVRAIWRKGSWLNFLIASPTSTFSGDCRASYL